MQLHDHLGIVSMPVVGVLCLDREGRVSDD